MPEQHDPSAEPTASDAIRRAITERRARVTMTPAVRIHIYTGDGYEGHYTVHEESDLQPSDNYLLDRALDEEPFTPELADAVYAAFSTQIDQAVECNATESERLGNLMWTSPTKTSRRTRAPAPPSSDRPTSARAVTELRSPLPPDRRPPRESPIPSRLHRHVPLRLPRHRR